MSQTEITADVIIQEALANPTDKNNLCTQVLDLFVSVLGAIADLLAKTPVKVVTNRYLALHNGHWKRN